MMPSHYVFRKVTEALKSTERFIRSEKNRHFKTTLSDHVLYAIICDRGTIKPQSPKKANEE